MFGKTHTEETKALISEVISGENHPRGMLGKTQSEQAKALISEANKGKTPRGQRL